ncbi:MAG: preprotein translocase subunit SecE [Actinomycetota bacterium]
MNRQYKRAMKKQEQQKKPPTRPSPKAAAAATKKERTKPRQFIKEVIAELRKVAWPTRPEVIAYSIVVIVSVVVIASLIFGMDYVFTKAILALFGIDS